MTLFDDMPLEEWRKLSWWPTGIPAHVQAGPPGHDREIVVGFDGYYDGWHNVVPELVVEAFTVLCPDEWKIENRGSRIEVHPTGHLFNGFAKKDVVRTVHVLNEIGFVAKVTFYRDPYPS